MVNSAKLAELPADQTLFDRGKDRLYAGRLEKTRRLPLLDPDLSKQAAWAELARNSHKDDIGLGLIIGKIADDRCRTLLGCRLVSEREWDENDVAEFERHSVHNAS